MWYRWRSAAFQFPFIMKSVVTLSLALTFVAITECAEELTLSDADLEFFKDIKAEQLPRELKIALTKSARSGGDSRNWCCTKTPPIRTTRRSRVVSKNTKVQTTVKTGYRKCNFWGKRCAKYEVRYSTKTEYRTEYYAVSDQPKCAEKDMKCCPNFYHIFDNCLTASDISHNKDLMWKLKESQKVG